MKKDSAMTIGAGMALGVAWSTNIGNSNPWVWLVIGVALVLQGGAVFGLFKD